MSLTVGAGFGVALAASGDRVSAASFGALSGYTLGVLSSQERVLGRERIYLSTLDDLALFNQTRPPDFPDASGAAARATSPSTSVLESSQRRTRAHEWISVGVHGIVGTWDGMGGPVAAPEATTIEQPQAFREGFLVRTRNDLEVPFRLDVSVRPLAWLRGGVFAGSFTTGDSLRNVVREEQQLRSVGSLRPYAEAILPLGRTGDLRAEVFAGAGLQSYSLRAVHMAPGSVVVRTPGGEVAPRRVVPVQQETQRDGVAPFFHIGAEFHSTRYTSLFVRHS